MAEMYVVESPENPMVFDRGSVKSGATIDFIRKAMPQLTKENLKRIQEDKKRISPDI